MASNQYRMDGGAHGDTVTTGNSGASVAGNGATCTYDTAAAAFRSTVGIKIVAAQATTPALRFATAAAANHVRILAVFTIRFVEDPASSVYNSARIRHSGGTVASFAFTYSSKTLNLVNSNAGTLITAIPSPSGGWVAGQQYWVYLDIDNSTGDTIINFYDLAGTSVTGVSGTYTYAVTNAIAAIEFGASFASGNATQYVGYLATADGAGPELQPPPTEVSVSDPVGLTDSASAKRDNVRSAADPVGVTDSVGATQANVRTASDQVGLTDSVTAVITAVRTIADSVGITDLPGPQVLDVALGVDDPAGVSDAVAQLMAAARTIADATGVSDAVTVVLDRAIAADDPIGVTDSAGTALDAGRSAADAAGVGDQVTVTLVAARAVGDPVGVTDSVTAVLTAAGEALVSDPAGITDEVTVSITSARGLADAAALTDSVLAVLSATAATDDQVATSDSVGAITVAVRTVTDGVAIVDTVTATLTRAELPNTPPGRRLTVEYESRTLYVRAGGDVHAAHGLPRPSGPARLPVGMG